MTTSRNVNPTMSVKLDMKGDAGAAATPDGSGLAPHFSMDVGAVLKAVRATPEGLSAEEAARRLAIHGPNQIEETKRKSALLIFLEQFKDLLVIILIVAAIISLVSGGVESTVVIFAVIILNAVLGTVQTISARKSLDSLKAMSAPMAKVLRDDTLREVPAVDLVPGDILVLEAGDMVCADGRIIDNFSLKVNESALTGESVSVIKTDETLDSDQIGIGDQLNMVFSSSLVTYGRAHAVVTATGMSTEIGKIARLMNDTTQRKTPLQKSLDSFSAKLAVVIIAICVLVFLLSLLRNGMSVIDSLMFAVALAVAAIPEALATIVTIALAIGTQKMARQHAIMKDLKAVETLGCVSIICSDKTGTLTQNKMTVERLCTSCDMVARDEIDDSDPVIRRLVRMGILASDAVSDGEEGEAIGDPTEIALVEVGENVGIDAMEYRRTNPRVQELAFDSDRKLMSTLHVLDGEPTLLTKGALDVLLDRTVSVMTRDGVRPITELDRRKILESNEDLSESGLRVLAFAYRRMTEGWEEGLSPADEDGYTFVGMTAMMDPPREESIQAVADARRGGIRTIMITGDHRTTSSSIARRIGIMSDDDIALEGVELNAMSEEELDAVLDKVAVYARVSPEHKIRIVDAWQRRGRIVAMTGDGVNDAPALKRADIGVAMGIAGTEVSKDAASMILSDDNFATIVQAVVNGRSVYANVRNTVLFLLSGNMAGIISVLFASLAGLAAPFAAVHLLFINLITDSLPAIAIGMEPARKDLLDQKPRDPDEPILSKRLFRRVAGQGALIAISTMTAYFVGLETGIACAMTMAFATLSLARLFHGFNCRSDHSVLKLGLLSNRFSLLAFVAGAGLLACVLFTPALQPFFEVSTLACWQIGVIVGCAFAPTVAIQIIKTALGKR